MRWWPVLLLLASPALAGEAALSGGEIRGLLPTIVAVGETSRQTFSDTGSTEYVDRGTPSTGRWWVEGDRYCSSWPPTDATACYDVLRDGARLIWVASDGGRIENSIEAK